MRFLKTVSFLIGIVYLYFVYVSFGQIPKDRRIKIQSWEDAQGSSRVGDDVWFNLKNGRRVHARITLKDESDFEGSIYAATAFEKCLADGRPRGECVVKARSQAAAPAADIFLGKEKISFKDVENGTMSRAMPTFERFIRAAISALTIPFLAPALLFGGR